MMKRKSREFCVVRGAKTAKQRATVRNKKTHKRSGLSPGFTSCDQSPTNNS
jgi:hypothetical protein